MKTLLVLGGTKFLGRNLLEKLDEKKFEVYFFHRGITNLHPFSNAIELLGDRTKVEDIKKLFSRRFDIVIDVSGEEYGMVELSVRYAKISQPYYIFISSSSVYKPSNQLHDERGDLNNRNVSCYIRSKIMSERLIERSFEKYAIVRTSKVYGPYSYLYRERYYMDRLIQKKQIVLANDPILHFTYVGDFVEGVVRLVDNELLGIYNVAGKEPSKLSYFIRILANKINVFPTILWDSHSDAPMTHLPTCILSLQKIYNSCGWCPRYTIIEGIEQTLNCWEG